MNKAGTLAACFSQLKWNQWTLGRRSAGQSSDDKWEGPGGWRDTEQNNKVRGSVVRGCSQPGQTASSRVSSYAGAPRLSATSRGRDRLWPSKSPVSESRRWREGGRAATAMRHREPDQLHFSVACVRPTRSHQQSVSGTRERVRQANRQNLCLPFVIWLNEVKKSS